MFQLAITRDVQSVLREIGLSSYEINAYFTLLEYGKLTAMEISKKAAIPYSKIYDVLNALKAKGWIASVNTRPTKYYPVSPLEALAKTKIKFEDKYAFWHEKIMKELQPLYEKHEIVERPDILILHGQESIIAKLNESIKKAVKEIMIAIPSFLMSSSDVAFSLVETLQKADVTIKVMADGKAEDSKELHKIAKMCELRFRDKMFGGGLIVDEKEAILFLGEEKASLVIWSNHIGLVRFAKEYFQFLWESS